MRQVLRMIWSRLNGDAKLRAKERSAKFGNEFFHCIRLAAKAAGEVPITPMGRCRPVRQLVQQS